MLIRADELLLRIVREMSGKCHGRKNVLPGLRDPALDMALSRAVRIELA